MDDLTCNWEACTPDRVLMALEHAKSEMAGDPKRKTTEHLAGIVLNESEPRHRTGLMVFVMIARFNEELLAAKPETCGIELEDDDYQPIPSPGKLLCPQQ